MMKGNNHTLLRLTMAMAIMSAASSALAWNCPPGYTRTGTEGAFQCTAPGHSQPDPQYDQNQSQDQSQEQGQSQSQSGGIIADSGNSTNDNNAQGGTSNTWIKWDPNTTTTSSATGGSVGDTSSASNSSVGDTSSTSDASIGDTDLSNDSASNSSSNSGGNTLSNGSESSSGSSSDNSGGNNAVSIDTSDRSTSSYTSSVVFIPQVQTAAPALVASPTLVVDKGACGPNMIKTQSPVDGTFVGLIVKSSIPLGVEDELSPNIDHPYDYWTDAQGVSHVFGMQVLTAFSVNGMASSRGIGLSGISGSGDGGNAGLSSGSSMQRTIVRHVLLRCELPVVQRTITREVPAKRGAR